MAQLVANCAGCHRFDNKPTGIPPIIGLDAHQISTMMRAFKSRPQASHIMRMLARALSDDEIDALATYLATIRPGSKP